MTWDFFAEVGKPVAESGLTWIGQSSALLALGLAAGRLLRRQGAAVESAVYRTALLAVLVCPAASMLLAGLGVDGFTFRLPEAEVEATSSLAPPARIIPANPGSTGPAITPGPPLVASKAIDGPVIAMAPSPAVSMPATTPLVLPSLNSPKLPAPARNWLAVGVAAGLVVWLLGVLLLGLRLARGLRAMVRLRGSAIPADPRDEALCLDLASRMGLAAPAVLRAPFLHSPCVDGLRRPAILLPDDADADLRDTFVHELAHLARRDVWWNLLRQAASAFFWFQPLLWVLSRRLEVAAEEVCDDYVVHFGADRASYAGLLVELARRTLPPVAPTALGLVSFRSLLARRVVRILDRSRAPSTRAGRRAVTLMLVAGLVGTSIAGLLGVGGPRRQAQAQAPAQAKEKPNAGTPTRGQVVGPDGRAVAGALVVAWTSEYRPDGIGSDFYAQRRVETTTRLAGDDGRFEIPADPRAMVLAKAPGFGPGHAKEDGTIRLTEGDRPILGRLVDLEGRPVAGASIRLLHLFTLPEPKDRRDAEARPGPYQFPYDQSFGFDGEQVLPGGVVTDVDGRFRIEGLGIDAVASLKIEGPTIASKTVKMMTRSMSRVTRDDTRDAHSMGLEEAGLYGADGTIVAQPSRPIEGIVRDLETGEPIPGAVVTAYQVGGQNLIIEGQLRATTDDRGHYRLLGLPVGNGHTLSVYPPLDRPYFITRSLAVPPRPGAGAVPFDIKLKPGAWITGRVSDRTTGRPVMASVDYFPMLDNPHAKDYANFVDLGGHSIEVKARYRTDADGRFRVVGLPGRGVATARVDAGFFLVGFGSQAIAGKDQGGNLPTFDRISPTIYQAIREVEVPADRGPATVDLPLDPGGSLVLKFVDEAGQPVESVVAHGLVPVGADVGDHNVYDHATSTRVGGLIPGKPRTVLLQQADRKLGAVVSIPGDGPRDGRDLTVVLRPYASAIGRVISSAGPLPPGASVKVSTTQADTPPGWSDEILVVRETLGSDGRFRIDDLPPGGTFEVRVVDRMNDHMDMKIPDGFKSFRLIAGLEPEPGQVVDLGTFDARTGKKVDAPAPVPAPAKPPQAADVPITGRIVDLEGRPVEGVAVGVTSTLTPRQGDLNFWLDGARQGQAAWIANGQRMDWSGKDPNAVTTEATTDRDGRFRLAGIGAERVVTLKLTGDSIAQTTIDVVTRRMDPVPALGFSNPYSAGTRTILGADFTYFAAPGRAVEGAVQDAATGRPIAGAEVRSYRFAGSDYVGIMTLMTRADERGRFRLAGFPKGAGNQLLIVPGDDQPYLMKEVELADPPGMTPIPVEVALKRGIWIEGRLTEQGTGKPVANARLSYLPFLENTFAQAHPSFDRNGNTDGSVFQNRCLSKADGSFRLVGLPGRAIVGALSVEGPYVQGAGSEAIAGMDERGHFPTYNNPINPSRLWPTTMKEINPASDAETVRVALQVRTGPSVALKVVDPDGQPLGGVSSRGLTERSSYEREKLAAAGGKVTNLRPGEGRQVVLWHDAGKLGKVVTVQAGDDARGPVVVKLVPLATIVGRVVDAEGRPVRAATVRPDVLPGGDFSIALPQASTDAEGKFLVPGVPTGCDYSLAVDNNSVAMKKRDFASLDKAVVKPGETTDVGEIRFK